MSENIFISGFIAGGVQTILGHPFDTLKTRMQIYKLPLISILQKMVKKEGIKSFYKGSLTPMVSGCIQNSIVFTSENYFQKYIKNNFFTGFLAGTLSSFVVSPAELIKCQIQNNMDKHITIMDACKLMKRKKINLYCGLELTMIRDSFGLGTYFGSYNYLQKKQNNPFFNGGIAGVLSWIVSYPFDVIKTKKQITNQSYRYILSNINSKQLVRGLNIVIIRSFIVNAGIFYTYETLLGNI